MSGKRPTLIEREHEGTGFSELRNQTLRDPRVSRGARGLLSEMLSYPPDYQLSIERLLKDGPESRYTLDKYMLELRTFGYAERMMIREGGKFVCYTWKIRSIPKQADPTAAKLVTTRQAMLEKQRNRARASRQNLPVSEVHESAPISELSKSEVHKINNKEVEKELSLTLSEKGENAFNPTTPGPLRAPLADESAAADPIPPLTPEQQSDSPGKVVPLGTKKATWSDAAPFEHHGNIHLKWFVDSPTTGILQELFPGVTQVSSATAKILRNRITEGRWTWAHLHFMSYCWPRAYRDKFTEFRQVVNKLEALEKKAPERNTGLNYTNYMMEEIGLFASESDFIEGSKETWADAQYQEIELAKRLNASGSTTES